MKNKGLKLVAIRPLKDCNKDFLKILSENTSYVFYNEYDFSNYDQGKDIEIKKENVTPDIFSFTNNFKKEINLNISAIVGENGSGKSSLVELFYVACYNISSIKGILFDEEEERYLNTKDAVKEINVEMFYEIDQALIRLNLIGTTIKLSTLVNGVFIDDKKPLDLNDFYYSLCINYSLHALNSKVLGPWLKKVFHKNDSYQTPIVLNPFRDEGNIEINNEEYLIKSRLISNILGKIGRNTKPEDSLRNVIDKKTAYKLLVVLNKDKFEQDDNGKVLFNNIQSIGARILPIVYKYFLKNSRFVPEDTILNKYAKEYILAKLKNIASKYQPYKRLFSAFYDTNSDAEGFIIMLSEDYSHVTFKLRQAINFLTNELYFKRGNTFDLTVAYLSKQLDQKKQKDGKELIDLLPPPFFDVDIEFKDSGKFTMLSSGEKQRIFSMATLIYHLSNLSSTEDKLVDLKYNRVNIVFDELELYFHPELQRNLVHDIIENTRKIDLKRIYAINILLITHSPFILSDIPENNILFLTEDGKPERKRDNIKTFGGNIHELLAHSFFLKNGFIGEFAKQKIQEVIDALQLDEENNLARLTRRIKLNQKTVLDRIALIGEPFLKQKLMEMYYLKFDKQKRIQDLKEEIKRLEQ